ncbi:MAG: phospholipid-binding lipoprotein MlaA [Glaciecola sp.]
MINQFRIVALLLAIGLGGCANQSHDEKEALSNQHETTVELADADTAGADTAGADTAGASKQDVKEHNVDPFEPINRVFWDFNYEVLDRFLVKPVTVAYITVTPKFVRTGLLNASENLSEPASAVNNLLQGKPVDSLTSVGRFLVNSTVGIVGLFDVASKMGMEVKEEDFGEVLGVWGVGTGPYLMLPALGPSDFRSLTGRVVDNVYWPMTILEDPYVIASNVVKVVEARASLLDQEENLNRSLDQYLFVRDAYFQRLAFKVSDGKVKAKTEEEIEAEQDDFSNFEDLLKDM